MAESLYTFICEFRGGTYIAQTRAVDVGEAVRNWARRMGDDRPIPRVSTQVAAAVLREDLPTPLEGLAGVWCMTATLGRSLILVNIVQS